MIQILKKLNIELELILLNMLKRIDTLMENFTKNKSIISIKKNRIKISKMKHKILDINNSKQTLSRRKIIRKYRLKQRYRDYKRYG